MLLRNKTVWRRRKWGSSKYCKFSYEECKRKGICVTCKHQRSAIRVTLNGNECTVEKRNLTKCWECIKAHRIYVKKYNSK